MAKALDDMISLDPGEAFEFSGGEVIGNMYERLVYYDLKNVSNIYGALAESWSVANDGKTYTFKLRPGIKFSSGNPVTAADVVYSIQRAVTLNKAPGFILTQFGINKDNASQRVRADDPMTVVMETEKAVAPTFFYYCLTAGVGSVIDSVVAKQHEAERRLRQRVAEAAFRRYRPLYAAVVEGKRKLHPRRQSELSRQVAAHAARVRAPCQRARDPAPAPGEG